jgi:hypothetical protein
MADRTYGDADQVERLSLLVGAAALWPGWSLYDAFEGAHVLQSMLREGLSPIDDRPGTPMDFENKERVQ